MKPKGIFLLSIIMLITATLSLGQTQFWSDTFEDTGAPSSGTRTPSLDQGGPTPPYTYYFLRTDGSNIALQAFIPGEDSFNAYQNVQGSKFWAGEDTDRVRSGANDPLDKVQHITWSGIDISGKSGLSFRGLFAAYVNQGWQNINFGPTYDFLLVEYRIDGGQWTKIGAFTGDDSATGGLAGRMREDTDGDWIGDGTLLTRTFQEFTWDITGTGNTLDLRFQASADGSTTQEFAIDNFRLFETQCVPPAIGTHPSDQHVCVGGNATFSITATGASTYQWQVNTGSGFANVSDNAVYSGATTPTLTITGVTGNLNGYTYRCVASEASCETPSNAATLISDLSASTSQTNVSCFAGSDGTATATATGGTGPYSYSWNTSPVQTTATATGLSAGAYTVTITDANGCETTRNFTITQPSPLMLSAVSQTDVACYGGSDGAATVNAVGGTGTYTYSWAPSGGTAATATGLSAGTYTVTVTDNNGCTDTYDFTITQPAALAASTGSQTDVFCFGGSNGSATVNVTGGTAPYTYSWTPSGGTAATATDLAAGTYTVTVTDNIGCTVTHDFTIAQPASALAASVSSQTDVYCFGGSNGSATVAVTGGTGPYTYSWAPSGGTAATATGLSPGSYTVTVTDNNGCNTTQNFMITQPSEINVSIVSVTPVGSYGGNDGGATVLAVGGAGGFTYSWSPSGGTAATAANLSAGIYTVTVTDANGCLKQEQVEITQPAPSANADLAGLVTGTTARLVQPFDSDNTAYNVLVYTGVADITITPTLDDLTATLTIDGVNATSGNDFTVPIAGTGQSIVLVVTAQDGSTIKTYTLTVTVNTPPVITNLSGDEVTFTEKGPEILLDDNSNATVTDGDSPHFAGGNLTVSIAENGVASEDVLGIRDEGTAAGQIGINGNNVTYGGTSIGTFTGGTNLEPLVVAFTLNATPAAVQTLIRSLTYYNSNTTNPSTEERTVSVTLNDGYGATSLPSEVTVNITAVNDVPVITTSGGPATFTEVLGDTPVPVAIDGGLTVSDPDNVTLTSATVSITDNFQANQDLLAFANDGSTMGNISGSYDAGLLTLTSAGATATLVQWQAALRAVTYSNTSKAPNTAARTITFMVNDGEGDSSPATKQVSITDVNDPPTIDAPASIEVMENVATALTAISFDDVDAGSGDIEVTFSIPGGRGALQATTVAGVTVAVTGSHMVNLEGTLAAINSYLADGQLRFINTPNDLDDVPVDVIINDGGNTGGGGPQWASEAVTITVRSTVPRITRVYSPDPDGYYGLESLITIHVEFDREVIATEVGDGIRLLLETGVPGRFASYAAGSGEETLVFHYTVQPGDENTHLDYLNTGALELAGGSAIASAEAGVGAELTLPTLGALASLSGSNQLIVDGIVPTVIAKDITLALDADGMATLVPGDLNDGSSDNLTSEEDLVFTLSQADFDCSDVGPVAVTLTVTDEAGNEGTATATLTVVDVTGPTVQTRNLILALDVDGQATITAEMVDNGSDDACGIAALALSKTEFNREDLGVNTITLMASDQSGNQSGAIATVVVVAFEDDDFVYDGTAKSLWIAGELPGGVEVFYTGNGQTEAGTYTVTATIDGGDDFNDLVLTAELEITKASLIDIITFDDGSFVYDGTARSITISGELPDGVTVSYTGNSQTEAGIYTVTASIGGGNNYDDLVLTAEMEITKAPLTGVIAFDDGSFVYDGTARSITISGELPDGVTVSYTGNGQTEAGIYTVTASIGGGNNYDDLVLTAEMEITKAPLTGVIAFDDGSFVYDSTAKSLAISGELPDGVTVSYTGNSQTEAGVYTVTATVDGGDNYNGLVLTAGLEITKAPLAGVITLDEGSFVYDGTSKYLSVAGELPDGVTVSYTGNGQTEVGVYTVTASIGGGNNYEDLVLTAMLEITAVPAISVTFPSASFVYDGTQKSLAIVGELPAGVTVTYTNNGRVDVGVQTVTATVDGGNSYEGMVLTATLEITPATRTLDFPPLPEQVYGDAGFSAGATASSGETVLYTSDNPSVAGIAGGLIRITGAGTAVITATVAVNNNYTGRPSVSRTLVVHKAEQTVSFSAPSEVSRDAGSVALDVSASSGLPVSLAVDDGQVATLEGTTLVIHRLGTVRITATQAGDGNYEPAEPVTVTVRVVDPSSAFPVRVHKAVSPNGDGINEFLMVEGIRDYPENRVTVLNRNGTVVWEASGYDNGNVAFRGTGTGGLRLPPGTYFYIAEVRVNGRWEHDKGYFVLRY